MKERVDASALFGSIGTGRIVKWSFFPLCFDLHFVGRWFIALGDLGFISDVVCKDGMCWNIWSLRIMLWQFLHNICSAVCVHSASSFEVHVSLFSCTIGLFSYHKDSMKIFKHGDNFRQVFVLLLYSFWFLSCLTSFVSCVNCNIFRFCWDEENITFVCPLHYSHAVGMLKHSPF